MTIPKSSLLQRPALALLRLWSKVELANFAWSLWKNNPHDHQNSDFEVFKTVDPAWLI